MHLVEPVGEDFEHCEHVLVGARYGQGDAAAVEHLKKNEIIAVHTDTIINYFDNIYLFNKDNLK